mgnify:CR=1 FL=1
MNGAGERHMKIGFIGLGVMGAPMASRVEILEQDYIPPRDESEGISSGVR